VSTLYNGTAEDKKLAREMKRKERFVSNFYVIDDPRDKQAKDDAGKVNGKVRLYEFPTKINEKLSAEEDEKEGLREAVYDPGDEGHNFIIKVKLTKPDENKRTFPDYSNSTFSRKAVALGTDKEIKAIMDTVISLSDHIKAMEKDEKWMEDTLVSEGLFQLVEREWNKRKGGAVEQRTVGTSSSAKKNEEDVPDNIGSPDSSDEDLLKELDNIKM
jgi:hypothetical protein